MGVAIIPATMADALDPEWVTVKRITDMTRISVLCYNKQRYRTKAVSLFYDTLIKTLEECKQQFESTASNLK